MNKEFILMAIGIAFVFSLLCFASYHYDRMPECRTEIEQTCYKYITSGGIFAGTDSMPISCNKEYDYYRNKTDYGIGCRDINIIGYD
jgi:hypothetical protein